MLHRELLIDGTFVGGPCDQSVGKALSRSPWDGRVLGTAAEGGFLELRTAVTAAHDAFSTWCKSTVSERQDLLRSISAAIRDRKEELVELLVDEVGKPLTFARAEIDRTAITFELAAAALESWRAEDIPLEVDPRGAQFSASVARFPLGPIFAIVPYNWPFNLAAHKLAPALATGNTVVLKAPPQAPLCTLTLARIIHEAGCPAGVVNAWYGEARDAERILRDDPRIQMLSFTGSPKVGWHLKSLFNDRKVTLELGGDAFAVLHSDADLDAAIPKLVTGGFGYAGQICISVQHVLAHASFLDEVRERLTEATRGCPTGDPALESTICGPMISEEAAIRVEEAIEEAIRLGASPLVVGSRKGRLVSPTLLENVRFEAKLGNEEAFGPILTLSGYESTDEMIQRVNRSRYGIHTGLFTKDPDVIRAAFSDLNVGGLVVNDVPTVRFDALPYGGTKQSGFGREGVRWAMEEMTVPRSLVTRLP